MDKQEQELQEKTIVDAISDYAKAYQKLEFIQRLGKEQKKEGKPILIPVGDQKTGVIGEYLGLKIIKEFDWVQSAEIAENTSQAAYDVKVQDTSGEKKLIQIKTVSHYHKTQTTSKFKHETDDGEIKVDGLLIIRLCHDMLSGDFLYIDEKTDNGRHKELFTKKAKTVSTKNRFKESNSVHVFSLEMEKDMPQLFTKRITN